MTTATSNCAPNCEYVALIAKVKSPASPTWTLPLKSSEKANLQQVLKGLKPSEASHVDAGVKDGRLVFSQDSSQHDSAPIGQAVLSSNASSKASVRTDVFATPEAQHMLESRGGKQ
jgi:hypothetical protein